MSRLYADHREFQITGTTKALAAHQHSRKTASPSLPTRIVRSEIDSLMSQVTAEPTSNTGLVARSPGDLFDRILSRTSADADSAADEISGGVDEGTHSVDTAVRQARGDGMEASDAADKLGNA